MLGSSLRCYGPVKCLNGVLAIHTNVLQTVASCKQIQTRNYAKGDSGGRDCTGCCRDIDQKKGKRIEPWPRVESNPPACPPAWNPGCPPEPTPPNYDPYRIKVPDVMVSPLPPSNAKWCGVVLSQPGGWGNQGQGYNQGQSYNQGQGYEQGQNYNQQYDEHGNPIPTDDKDGGLIGVLKSFFGRGKKKDDGNFNQIVAYPQIHLPMLKCVGSACSPKKAPPPPPCPVPPKKPFNWIPVIIITAIVSAIGLIYKYYVYREDMEKAGAFKPIWRPRKVIKRPSHEKDLPPCTQYLIIGTGAAGWSAYLAIKEHDKKAKVFLLSKEDIMPYIRPPMSKYMWWNSEPPNLKSLEYLEDMKRKTMYYAECKHFMDPVKFYRKKNGPAVSIATGWCVTRMDADDHIAWVKTPCGEIPIYYERALLAPGSKPITLTALTVAPKVVREKATTLREIRDLEKAYRKVREAKHVTVIGGGPLGTELAYFIGRMHKEFYPPLDGEERDEYVPPKVVHIYKGKGILSSLIPEYLGEWAAEKLKCENVTMMPNTQVYDLFESEDGRLELTLSTGEHIVTDYALVAIGNLPREELAKKSFLELDPINGGYKVNTEMEARTDLWIVSTYDYFSTKIQAGDAASVYTQWKDTRLRTEHYMNAVEQGYVAGANMTGYWIPYNSEPNYWIRLAHDLEIQIVGEVGACMPTVGIFKPCEPPDPIQAKYEALIGENSRPCYKDTQEWKNRYRRGILFYLRDDVVVGMCFWNFPPIEDRKEVAQELLRARVSYEEVGLLAELLGFKDLECVYVPKEMAKAEPVCVKTSLWSDPIYLKIAGKTASEENPALKKKSLEDMIADDSASSSNQVTAVK